MNAYRYIYIYDNLEMLKGIFARLINVIKDIKLPQRLLVLWMVSGILVEAFENTSKMRNTFFGRIKGIIESWRNPEDRQQQYKIEMPYVFISVFSVVLAAILLYNRMFKLILTIVVIFASAFYLRYLIMADGLKQKEAKKAKKLDGAKQEETKKAKKLANSSMGQANLIFDGIHAMIHPNFVNFQNRIVYMKPINAKTLQQITLCGLNLMERI